MSREFSPTVSHVKDPSAILDYPVRWSQWLEEGDFIVSASIIGSPGIIVDRKEHNKTDVRFWVSGGTHGENYFVVITVITANGRTDRRTIPFEVRDQ